MLCDQSIEPAIRSLFRENHVWSLSTKLWSFMRVRLSIALIKCLPTLRLIVKKRDGMGQNQWCRVLVTSFCVGRILALKNMHLFFINLNVVTDSNYQFSWNSKYAWNNTDRESLRWFCSRDPSLCWMLMPEQNWKVFLSLSRKRAVLLVALERTAYVNARIPQLGNLFRYWQVCFPDLDTTLESRTLGSNMHNTASG